MYQLLGAGDTKNVVPQSSKKPPITRSAGAAAAASINKAAVSKPTTDVIVGLKSDG